jgi:5-methyltetrahydropteroyltriglutamate--homocysteine methyltransferase
MNDTLSARTGPPFRAEHVGSLLRPVRLLRAREAHEKGEIGPGELQAVEDDAIKEVVALQEELGFAAVTDGELRRNMWHMDFLYQLKGVVPGEQELHVAFRTSSGERSFGSPSPALEEPIHLGETIFGKDFSFLSSIVQRAVPKLTIPSPSMLHFRAGTAALTGGIYDDLDEAFADLAAAYAEEVDRLFDLGCTYLQLDDTSLAYLNDPRQRDERARHGENVQDLHRRYIDLINAAMASRPAAMTVAVHLCRGNYRSSWAAEGGYDHVAEALFGELDVDGYFLEYDDERSGDFRPLRYVPPDKVVVLGLITTKHGRLEDKDELIRRVEQASHYVALDKLCLSPQCGFSSTLEGNDVTFEEQRAKLQLVVEVAEEIWR